MVFLSFFNTNLAFFALGVYKLKFSGDAYDFFSSLIHAVLMHTQSLIKMKT